MPVWFRGRGGGWCESWSPPTLYSPGGKLVFCNMDSRKSGGCVPPNASLSWLIRLSWIQSYCCLQLRSRQSSVPVCQCTCMVPWPRGRLVFNRVTPRMSWGTPHGRAVAPKMIKLRRSSIVACYRNLSSIVACNRNLSSSWASLSGALGSVPAGWVRLRPALGFRFRRFGVMK